MRAHRAPKAATVLLLLASIFAAGPARAVVTCSQSPAFRDADAALGGDWSWDGQNLLGQRNQTAENAIGLTNVAALVTKWTTTIPAGSGGLSVMPIVAEGCVYLQSGRGTSNATSKYKIIALNAETGELVWAYELKASGAMAAPHVVNGVVYVNEPTRYNPSIPQKGPHAIALDSQTGALLWEGETICEETGCANTASATSPAMYYDGFVWVGLTNGEQDGSRQGGFGLVDARNNGALMKRTYVVPSSQIGQYGGCSIWSTPAVDPVTSYGYVGVGQPSTWGVDDENGPCNSIIKFDLARARDENGNPVAYSPGVGDPQYTNPNFGEIVGRMKGNVDGGVYTDVDFGGSAATIFTDANGKQIVAQEQKSSTLWAAYTSDMSHAWDAPNGFSPGPLGAYAKTATDGKNIFTLGFGAPNVFAHDVTTGVPRWVGPALAPTTAGSLAYANGLVYFTDQAGVVYAYEATTGALLLAHRISGDGSGCSAGVANAYGTTVARHRVFAVCGTRVVALGLP